MTRAAATPRASTSADHGRGKARDCRDQEHEPEVPPNPRLIAEGEAPVFFGEDRVFFDGEVPRGSAASVVDPLLWSAEAIRWFAQNRQPGASS